MSFENWRQNATKVEKPRGETEAEDENVLSADDLALIDRVLAESPEVAPKGEVPAPKEDELLHVARTDAEMIADAQKGINPHGLRPAAPGFDEGLDKAA